MSFHVMTVRKYLYYLTDITGYGDLKYHTCLCDSSRLYKLKKGQNIRL